MPHVPLFCSKKFLGKSGVGLYGDVIMEINGQKVNNIGDYWKALGLTAKG